MALVGELLARPMRVATRELGEAPAQAVLALPSGWPPDGRRARALRAATALAGLPPATLVSAAVAAAELLREDRPATVLVCDVGGRSCQISLVEVADGPARLLATTELVVGADLFDELLYLDVLRDLGKRDAAAAGRLEDLHLLAGTSDDDRDIGRWIACQAELARTVRHAREALASATSYELAIGDPVGLALGLEQSHARDLLLQEMLVLASTAREQISQARLSGALAAGREGHPRVLLVGGGALTPGLRDTLEAELDLPVVADDDPVTAVARGALRAASRSAAVAAVVSTAPAPEPPRGPPENVSQGVPVRTVLEDVVVAAMGGDDVVAVVRHDAHHRVVRVDISGRVLAAHGVAGGPVTAVAGTPAVVIVSTASQAAVLTGDLRQLTTIERPLLCAAAAGVAWVVAAGGEPSGVLELTTLSIAGREAHVREVRRLGLVMQQQEAIRRARRGRRIAPPAARGFVIDDQLHFAVPARGRSGQPAQRVGLAGPSGLLFVDTRTGPAWVTALAATADGGVVSLAGGPAATLSLGSDRLADWPPGVRVWLVAHAPLAPWVVAARGARWEALRLDDGQLGVVRSGDGTVEHAGADEDGLRLVCESGGKRRLVRVSAGGELVRLGAASAALEPLGRSGGEILVLSGSAGGLRRLVSFVLG